MRRKRFAPEKIISMLREAEVGLSQGLMVGNHSIFRPYYMHILIIFMKNGTVFASPVTSTVFQ